MIIAVKEKDRVVVAISVLRDEDILTAKDATDIENLPIKFAEDGKLIAFGKAGRIADLFLYDEYFLKAEKTPFNMIKNVIPGMMKVMKDNKIDTSDNTYFDNTLIICDNEHLYSVYPDKSFFELDDYCSDPCEDDFIRSVMDATVGQPAEERIEKTISFLKKMNLTNAYPYVVVDTKDKRFKCVFESEGEK